MPLTDGLVRRYDALELTDGFVGSVEYTYVADEDGDIVVFADRRVFVSFRLQLHSTVLFKAR